MMSVFCELVLSILPASPTWALNCMTNMTPARRIKMTKIANSVDSIDGCFVLAIIKILVCSLLMVVYRQYVYNSYIVRD